MKKFSKVLENKSEINFNILDSIDKLIEYSENDEYDNFLDHIIQFLDLGELDGQIEYESFKDELDLADNWESEKKVLENYNVLKEAYGHIYPHILFLKDFIEKQKNKRIGYFKKINNI